MDISNYDEEGFLTNTNTWTGTIAQEIAFDDGIGQLSKQHYLILNNLREHFLKTGSVTPTRFICHQSNLGSNCINELFSNHGVEAWKIAGLPDPGEEAKTYM